MKGKKRRVLAYLIASVLALGIAWIGISLTGGAWRTGPEALAQALSNGFFLVAVLYLGCGALSLIAEAGNFYGIQFLGYTLVRIFSPRKERFADRKDYFTYCTEKKAQQKERGSAAHWVLVHVGILCLAVSGIAAVVYYQMMAN